MSSNLEDVTDSAELALLTCGVCGTVQQNGAASNNCKVLPCLHACCGQCLETSLTTGELKCQNCEEKFEKPIAELKPHYVADIVMKIAEARRASGKRHCETCASSFPSSTCEDCQNHVCDDCATMRHPEHRVRSFNGSTAAGDSEEAPLDIKCDMHEEEAVKLFCDTCKVPICQTCTYVRHEIPKHNFVELDDASQEFKKLLASKIADVQRTQDSAGESKVKIEETSETFARQYQETRDAIQKHAKETLERFQKEIEDRERRMLDHLELNYNGARDTLNTDAEQLQKIENHMKLTGKFMKVLINHGSNGRIMSAFTEITTQLDGLSIARTQRQQISDDFLLFTPEEITLDGELGSFGKVESIKPKLVDISEVPSSVRVGETFAVPIDSVDVKTAKNPKHNVLVELFDSQGKRSVLDVVQLSRDKKVKTRGVKVLARSSGPHELSIKVGNKHLKESPYRFGAVPWKLTRAFARQGSGLGELDFPYGIDVTEVGDVAVADHRNHRVQIFRRSQLSGGSTGEFVEFKEKFFPRDVAVSGDLFFITVDVGALNKGKVIVRNEDASIRSSFGESDLKVPTGVAINSTKNKVYVADSRGHCVCVYSKDRGDLVSSVGTMGNDLGLFDHPEYIAVDSHNRVIVSDYYNKRLQLLDPDGRVISEIADGKKGASLSNPRGVAVDVYDNIYVCDSDLNTVQKFSEDGRFICRLDSDTDKLVRPIGLAVTKDSLCEVFVSDNASGCINMYF